MENFMALSEEKQHYILSAAFYCFGKMGYKKTSVADIAEKAGISKAMVFHYFGNKKNLYFYLLQTACSLMEKAIAENINQDDNDFFESIIADIKSKEMVIDVYPSVLQFLSSVIREDDAEIVKDIIEIKKNGIEFHAKYCLGDVDLSKFKESVNPNLVFDLITSYMENLTLSITQNEDADISQLFKKAFECVEMLKCNFYKPEYLEG